MLRLVLIASCLAACAPSSEAGDAGEGEGEGEGEGNCVAVSPGAWSGAGSCFGMDMAMTVAVDGCTVTFSEWNMAMSVPEGGTVVGSQITMTGAQWTDCTGTVGNDGTHIDGTCADGCTFNLAKNG